MDSIRLNGDHWMVEFPAFQSGDSDLELALLTLYQEKFEIMVQRHRKYGPNNIAESGRVGILTRLRDKIARFLNQKDDAKDETMNDTLIDLANYGDILALWEWGKWPRKPHTEACGECGRDL